MRKHTVEINEMTPQGAVTKCHNLLKEHRGGRPVLVAAPGMESLGQGFATALATFRDTGGSAHNLFAFSSDECPCGWMIECCGSRTIGQTASRLLCAIPTAGGFIAMTANGAMRLTLGQQGWQTTSEADLPINGITIEPVECGTITAHTEPLTLNDVELSRSNSAIGKTGLSRISSTLSAAYTRLADICIDGAMWLQPVVARYHLVNEAGQRIYSSMPMIACADSGWQCAAELSASCTAPDTKSFNIPSIALTANPYKLQLRLAPDHAQRLAASGVKTIEIEASPQVHPFDPTAQLPYRIKNPTSGSPVLTIALPGATTHFNHRNEMRRSTLRAIAADISSYALTEMSLGIPPAGDTITIGRRNMSSLTSEIALTSKATASAIRASASTATAALQLAARISSPNRFTANTVATDGDTIVWGDITPLPTSAVNIGEICRDFTDSSFEGVLTVSMRSGESHATAISGPLTPTAWAPSVSYPDCNAARLTIDIKSDSGLRLRGTVELQPDSTGASASAISLTLGKTTFSTASGPLPPCIEPVSQPDRHPGALVACRLTSPLTPTAAAECCHSPVVAVHPAVRSQSSWDFSRCHLYAMTSYGIYAVAVNTSRAAITASLIDSRGISHGGAAVRTSAGIMALHRGQLLKISASRAETVATGLDAEHIAWDPATQRLWLLDQSGNLTVRSADGSGSTATIPSPADFQRMATIDNRLWLTDTDELYRLQPRLPAGALVPVAWQSAIDLPDGARVGGIDIHMSASSMLGTVRLLCRRSPGGPLLTAWTLRINGAVDSTLPLRIAMPARPYHAIAIDATVSSDFQLHSITIHHSSAHETDRSRNR